MRHPSRNSTLHAGFTLQFAGKPPRQREPRTLAPYYDNIADHSRTPALRFVSRIHCMRMLGTALCAIPIAAVLQETGAPAWTWVAMVINALAWPQIAWLLAHRARAPAAVEYRNLLVDAAMGGMWIAIIGVDLLPSAVRVTMLSADRFAAGG